MPSFESSKFVWIRGMLASSMYTGTSSTSGGTTIQNSRNRKMNCRGHQEIFEHAYAAIVATATDSTTVPTEISIEFTNDDPMLAPSHARRNAPRLAVVGRPICEFAQSRFVRNAFDAIT